MAEMEDLVKRLLLPDNDIRNQAEREWNRLLRQAIEQTMLACVQLLRGSADEGVSVTRMVPWSVCVRY